MPLTFHKEKCIFSFEMGADYLKQVTNVSGKSILNFQRRMSELITSSVYLSLYTAKYKSQEVYDWI